MSYASASFITGFLCGALIGGLYATYLVIKNRR